MREFLNVTYAVLAEGVPAERRDMMDEMLNEPYLSEFPEGLERNREEARRLARSMGVDQAGALQAMGMPRANPGSPPRIQRGGPLG